MTSWKEAREKLHAENPRLKEEYDLLGPRFEALSRLVDARQRMHLSQSEIARRMEVPANVVSRFESAQHSPRLDTIIAYARALGYEINLSLKKTPVARPAAKPRPTRARTAV
jgi:transcriptional regulator with XRE-family HTH domain